MNFEHRKQGLNFALTREKCLLRGLCFQKVQEHLGRCLQNNRNILFQPPPPAGSLRFIVLELCSFFVPLCFEMEPGQSLQRTDRKQGPGLAGHLC